MVLRVSSLNDAGNMKAVTARGSSFSAIWRPQGTELGASPVGIADENATKLSDDCPSASVGGRLRTVLCERSWEPRAELSVVYSDRPTSRELSYESMAVDPRCGGEVVKLE